MKALSIVRKILLISDAVTEKRAGEIWVNAADQNDPLPNVQMILVSGLEDFTHSGPSGLIEDRVRIWCRGKTDRQAAELGAAVHGALQGYVGVVDDANVQLIRRVMTVSDYQDGAKVHRCIIDVEVHWNAR